MNRSILILAAGILMLGALPLGAQSTDHSAHASATARIAQAPDSMTDGEVRKVDKDAKKITLRHGPIPNLDMPPMTMVFQAKNPALLDQVKPGDKVKFSAEKVGSQYVVTHIEHAR